MKVAELIEQLQRMPPDARVYYVYNYGDHWRTQVAGSVQKVATGTVTYSDYHQMMKVVDSECEDGEEGTIAVVLE